jgi:hypothetical protein
MSELELLSAPADHVWRLVYLDIFMHVSYGVVVGSSTDSVRWRKKLASHRCSASTASVCSSSSTACAAWTMTQLATHGHYVIEPVQD